MHTKISNFLDTSTNKPVYSFQFSVSRKGKGPWKYVDNGTGVAATWSTRERRDQARACFTHRRTVEAAMAALRAGRLLPTTKEKK